MHSALNIFIFSGCKQLVVRQFALSCIDHYKLATLHSDLNEVFGNIHFNGVITTTFKITICYKTAMVLQHMSRRSAKALATYLVN